MPALKRAVSDAFACALQVFELFSKLVVCASGRDGAMTGSQLHLGQELQAFLHKQMSSSDVRTQRVGIIGTARLVHQHQPPCYNVL